MRLLKCFLFLYLFYSLAGCALSPAREVLKKGDYRVNVSLGGAIVDQVRGIENIPIPVNLGLGALYGINDGISAEMTLYPIPLLAGNLLVEPSGVFNIVESNAVKQLNTEIGFPTMIQLNKFGVESYPTMGLCPVFGNDQEKIYTVFEIQFDFTEPFKIHLNWKLGGEYQVWTKATLGAEIGLLNIAEESVVSPLSRAGIGVPVFSVGSSIDVK